MEHSRNNVVSNPMRLNKILPQFETIQDVRDRKADLVKHLKAGKRATRRVARKLRKCRRYAVCGSPICPQCVRGLRKSWAPAPGRGRAVTSRRLPVHGPSDGAA